MPPRVTALYDIHGNLPALHAVFADPRFPVNGDGAHTVVVGGDVIPGPFPNECLDLLRSRPGPLHCITGNGEREILNVIDGKEPATVPEVARPIIRWTAEQLTPGNVDWLRTWPSSVRLDDVLFCHATPRNDTEIFTRATAESRLAPIFGAAGVPTVVCGHTHMQFDRMVGTTRVINAGSVGMPFGMPGAYWLQIGNAFALLRTDYDLAAAVAAIRGSPYPQAESFAMGNVLKPPSEAQMIEAFGRAELVP